MTRLNKIYRNTSADAPCLTDKTFREATEVWRREYSDRLADTTRTNYNQALESRVLPEIGDMTVRALTPKEIDRAVARIAGLAKKSGRELKPRTQLFMRDLITSIVSYTYTRDYPETERIKLSNDDQGVSKLDPWQIEKLCVRAKYDRSVDMLGVLLMLFVGVRSGELCALSWDDVDLERRDIFIHNTAHRIRLPEADARGRKTVVKTTEISWENQIRHVDIPQELMPFITGLYKPKMSVMTGLPDTPMDQRTLINRMSRIFDLQKLENVNAQRLRKTWSEGEADIEILRRALGEGKQEPVYINEDINNDISESGTADRAVPENEEINRGTQLHRMAAELSELRAECGISAEQIAAFIGMDVNRLRAVETGRQNFTWTEYLLLLLLFRRDERGRSAVEERGLFPDEIRHALSVFLKELTV